MILEPMLFRFIFPVIQCADAETDNSLGINICENNNEENEHIVENINADTDVQEIESFVEGTDNEQETVSITDSKDTNQYSIYHDLDNIIASYRQRYEMSRLNVDENNLIDKIDNDNVNEHNLDDNIVAERNTKNSEAEDFKALHKRENFSEPKIEKASDALLFSLNHEIEEYNKARRLSNEKDDFLLTKNAIYKFLRISWLYKEILRYSDVKEEYQRADIIHKMLVREKNELELFIDLKDNELMACNDVKAKDCEMILLGLERITGTRYEETIKQSLDEITDEEWKIYDDSKIDNLQRDSCYHTDDLKENINEISSVIEEVLNELRVSGFDKRLCELMDYAYTILDNTKKNLENYEKRKPENFTEYYKEFNDRLRQLLVCLYMGAKESGKNDLEKEIKELQNQNYKQNFEENIDPHRILEKSLMEKTDAEENKKAITIDVTTDLYDSGVFTEYELIKSNLQDKSVLPDNALHTEEACKTLRKVHNEMTQIPPANNENVLEAKNYHNGTSIIINDDSVQPDNTGSEISNEKLQTKNKNELDQCKTDKNNIKSEVGAKKELSDKTNAIDSIVLYAEKILLITIIICVITAVCILGAALTLIWKG